MKKISFLLFAIILLTGCSQIDSGNVGVRTWMGKVNPQPLGQGVTLTIDSVTEFTTKEVLIPVADLKPKSRDNLTLRDLDLDVYIAATPNSVPTLFIKYQGDYIRHGSIVEDSNTPSVNIIGYQRILREAREAAFKAVARYDATTMHTKRDELASDIQRMLQAGLDMTDKGAFTVTNVNVKQLTTDPGIEDAIRAQVKVDQDIAKKEKEIALATKEAERLEAQALGEARANEIVSASLSDRLIQLRLAELQRDTVVQSAAKGNTIIHGNATPLIQTK